MRPAARLQAAIELLDEIIVAARDNGPAADSLARKFFANRRYAGSKDRRAVREHVWDAIRRFGERPQDGRSVFAAMATDDAELAALFDGSDYGPAVLIKDEAKASGGKLPEWILPILNSAIDGGEQAALLERAPLDIRINTLKSDAAEVRETLPEASILDASKYAFRLPTGFAVDNHSLANEGKISIQDLGSQLIAESCHARPGMTALDLCAGAGGKTLALASDMKGQGRLIASDINRNRLDQLGPRARRAGASEIVESLLLNPGKELDALGYLVRSCDIVLVDAPCSGSGTWRRNPETRWRLTPKRLDHLVEAQSRLLDIAAQQVKSGGVIVYAVCSLIDKEGRAQVADFLARNDGWQADPIELPVGRQQGDGIMLTPAHDSTDGFFFARLQKL